MKSYNTGDSIIIKGSHDEIAILSMMLEYYVKNHEGENVPKEIHMAVRNPEVDLALKLSQDIDSVHYDSERKY